MKTNLQEVIAKLRQNTVSGITTHELRLQMGWSRSKALIFLNQVKDAGLLEFVGRKQLTGIDGRPNHSPAYRFLKVKK